MKREAAATIRNVYRATVIGSGAVAPGPGATALGGAGRREGWTDLPPGH